MQIFNFGILEIVLIVLLVLIVLGPKRGLRAAKDVGAWVRKTVKSPVWQQIMTTSNEIKDIPNKILDESGLDETIQALSGTRHQLNQEFNQTTKTIEQEIRISETPDIEQNEQDQEDLA